MSYSLFTQSFGSSNANATVKIINSVTGEPATILASSAGGIVNTNGNASLDASGTLNVYIDTSKSWTVMVNDPAKPVREPAYLQTDPDTGAQSVVTRKGDSTQILSMDSTKSNNVQQIVAGAWVDPGSSGVRVYTITSADMGRTISNRGSLPMWVFIPKGLTGSGIRVVQRGRGRVYVCPGSGVEVNGVTGVGRWSTCRRGQVVNVSRVGDDAYTVDIPRRDVVHAGASDYFLLDVTGATYSVTGDLVTVTHTGHGLTSDQNGRSVYMLVATGPLFSTVFDNWTYVDANTYTVKAPNAIPLSKGAQTGTFRAYDGNGQATNLVNAPNTILIGGSGATYSVIGNRITVTWTAHGMTNSLNGANVHMTFTGQSLTTGVYRNFLYVDANTFEVQSPVFFSTVSTGSLTANTAETCLLHHILPGDTIGDGGHLEITTKYTHRANANNKFWRIIFGRHGSLNGTAIRKGQSASTTTSTTEVTQIFPQGPTYIETHGGTGTELSYGPTTVAEQFIRTSFDITNDQTLKFTAQVANAADWMCLRAAVIEADRGRNVSKLGPGGVIGLNMGALGSGTRPGVPYVDYTGTSLSQYQRWASKGIKLFRLGFLWERVQQSLSGPLDGPATAIITEQLDFINSVGGKCLLDVHNYMKYNGVLIGSGPTQADLVDLWVKLVTLWKNHPAVWGWGLMNEPNSGINIPTLNTILQAVVDNIRTLDTAHLISVSGMSGSMVSSISASEALRVYDSANKLVIEAHSYPDAGYGGVVTNYLTDTATYNSSVQTQPQGVMGYTQVLPYAAAFFDQYLRNNRAMGIVGECGAAGNDDVRWMSDNWSYGLAAMLSRGWPVFVWSGGGGNTGSQTYPFSVEPLIATPDVDRPQWTYMEPMVRAFNT